MSTNDKIDVTSLKGPEALFKTDKKLEQEGIWLDYGDFRIRVTRAGATNKRFKTALDSKLKPHRRAIANDRMNDDVLDRITQEAWAETVVIGWDSKLGDNVMPYQGKSLPFTVDNCKQLFADIPDLFIDVREQSMKLALFVTDTEVDTGN